MIPTTVCVLGWTTGIDLYEIAVAEHADERAAVEDADLYNGGRHPSRRHQGACSHGTLNDVRRLRRMRSASR
jgi:hypothetical protein